MKPSIVLLALLAVTACNKSSKDSKDPRELSVLLKGCNTNVFGNDAIKICYDSLHESRCPIGGYCIWEGVATGYFSFYINADKFPVTLSTSNIEPYGIETTVRNYKIELLNIDPYPGLPSPPPATAKVRITKL